MSEPRDNAEAGRYELDTGQGVAFADYVLGGERITFPHTVVPAAAEGQGVGSRLIRFALDDARARGLTVVPQCSFVASYIERHAEYRNLLAGD